MLNPMQEVLARPATTAEAGVKPRQSRRGGKKLVATIGKLISVAFVAATATALAVGAFVGLWFATPQMSVLGLVLLVWSAIMSLAALATASVVRRYKANGTVPSLPAPLAIGIDHTRP
jgi:hypothetical protein